MDTSLSGSLGLISLNTTLPPVYGAQKILISLTVVDSNSCLSSLQISSLILLILPNSLGTIVTSTVLMIPGIIFTESSLSYLGLGLQGTNSFGDILAKNQAYIQIYPMLIIFPAVIISLLMISFNLFGNGLRDALNPSLKGSE